MRARIAAAASVAVLAAAGPAAAQEIESQAQPVCAAVLAGGDVGATGSCVFEGSAPWTLINVVTDGSVTILQNCLGSSYTASRSYVGPGRATWYWRANGLCTLTVRSDFPGTTATATASPIAIPLRP